MKEYIATDLAPSTVGRFPWRILEPSGGCNSADRRFVRSAAVPRRSRGASHLLGARRLGRLRHRHAECDIPRVVKPPAVTVQLAANSCDLPGRAPAPAAPHPWHRNTAAVTAGQGQRALNFRPSAWNQRCSRGSEVSNCPPEQSRRLPADRAPGSRTSSARLETARMNMLPPTLRPSATPFHPTPAIRDPESTTEWPILASSR